MLVEIVGVYGWNVAAAYVWVYRGSLRVVSLSRSSCGATHVVFIDKELPHVTCAYAIS